MVEGSQLGCVGSENKVTEAEEGRLVLRREKGKGRCALRGRVRQAGCILKLEPKAVVGRLDVECERRRCVQDSSMLST